jgi:hypothetical protein
MPAVVTTVIHAPTLEQLSNWSASLDTLPWSLDDAIWPEADLCTLKITEGAAASERVRASVTTKHIAKDRAVSAEKAIGQRLVRMALAFTAKSTEDFPSIAIVYEATSAESCAAVVQVVAEGQQLDGTVSESLSGFVTISASATADAVASELCAPGIIFKRSGNMTAESGETCQGSRLYRLWARERGQSFERCVGRVIVNAHGVGLAFSGEHFYGELRGHGWTLLPWDESGGEWRPRAV